jgi:hypothetical protein
MGGCSGDVACLLQYVRPLVKNPPRLERSGTGGGEQLKETINPSANVSDQQLEYIGTQPGFFAPERNFLSMVKNLDF